jgi:hypothetical protein
MSRPRLRAVAFSVLLVCWLLAGSVAFAMPAAAATIEIDNTLAQTDAKGEIDVGTQVTIPDGMVSMELTVPEGAEVYETNGFSQAGERTYEWTRSTNQPSVRYSLAANHTIDRGSGEKYLYAVTDQWAVVRSPNIRLQWRGVQSSTVTRNHVDGEGVAGNHIIYLGGYEEHTREAAGQQFRLAVSEYGEMRESPADVLDSLAHAAEHIEIGARDEEVQIIAVPSNVDWAATGVQRGDSDLWVRDNERLDTARNTWVHEYVHTRQDYDRTEETGWTIEGMADYYAALLTYEQGRIDFEEFQRKIERGSGSRYSDVRLTERETWEANRGNYEKGGLVFGHLDRRLRADADTTLHAAIAEFNQPGTALTQQRFLDSIESVGNADIRADAKRYTETTDVPPAWDREQHLAAFGGADIRYAFESYAISGPYRETGITEPRLVTGETLETTVGIRNLGTERGEYTAEFHVNDEVVAEQSGTVAADGETMVTFQRRFETAGEYELSVGSATTTVTVEEPAGVSVTELTADPTTPEPEETVTLRATVESEADRPADDEVAFVVDGETVATERVRVADGSVTVEATTSFETPGEHTVEVGVHSSTVSVREPIQTATPTAVSSAGTPAEGSSSDSGSSGTDEQLTPTQGSGAGLGALPAVIAMAAALLLFTRR